MLSYEIQVILSSYIILVIWIDGLFTIDLGCIYPQSTYQTSARVIPFRFLGIVEVSAGVFFICISFRLEFMSFVLLLVAEFLDLY